MPSRIAWMASGVERSTSVSSMRRMKRPLLRLANAHANNAVRAPPKCRNPVGLGAKRVRTEELMVDTRWTSLRLPAKVERGRHRRIDRFGLQDQGSRAV